MTKLMKYMIIEKHKPNSIEKIYERFNSKGRLMPVGLFYIDSWISRENPNICFQVMETDDRQLLDEWISCWSDLTDFEVVETMTSGEAKKIFLKSEGSNV